MENKDRLRGLESFEALVRSVLIFGINYINILKVKEIRVLLRYQLLRPLLGVPLLL